MDENKRKSSRSFELEKGGKRSFDLNKTSTRKFDLAKESDESSLEELKKELLADGVIDSEEVNKLREVLYADGKIDQEEADFVFELNDAVSGKKNDPSWNQFFVQVISDYLLNDEKSPGVIDEEEGKWLIEKIGADGQVDGVEKQLLSHLQKSAKKMPVEVTSLIAGSNNAKVSSSESVNLKQLKKEILADGKIDKEEVNLLRKTLYADGKIDQEEADFVFELNDAVSGKKNDPSWNQFFVQVISDYLLNDEKSPGVIDEEEGKWLIEKIGADGQVDGIEKQLLSHLQKSAKKMPVEVISLIAGSNKAKVSSSESVNLKQLKKEILADGKIDKEEVNLLRKTLYADGKIDQEEADFVFELNDAVCGKKNDPSWNQFFVQVISDYLLNDEKSPGVIDEEEGKWLIEKIGADGQVDGVEKQLLDHLKKKAKKIPPSVVALQNGNVDSQGVSTSDGETSSDESGANSKKWIWILLAIVMAAVIAYFCMKSCDANKDEQPTEQMTSSVTGENSEQVISDESSVDNIVSEELSAEEIPVADNSSAKDAAENADNLNSSRTASSSDNSTEVQRHNGDNKISASDNNSSNSDGLNTVSQQSTTATPKQVTLNGSVEETALDVIRGIYGNGLERIQKLGDRYKEIQSIVNDMYRKGLVR